MSFRLSEWKKSWLPWDRLQTVTPTPLKRRIPKTAVNGQDTRGLWQVPFLRLSEDTNAKIGSTDGRREHNLGPKTEEACRSLGRLLALKVMKYEKPIFTSQNLNFRQPKLHFLAEWGLSLKSSSEIMQRGPFYVMRSGALTAVSHLVRRNSLVFWQWGHEQGSHLLCMLAVTQKATESDLCLITWQTSLNLFSKGRHPATPWNTVCYW